MHDLAVAGDECFTGDFVVHVERELSIFDEMGDECRQILGEHLAGMIGHVGRQIGRAEDCDVTEFDSNGAERRGRSRRDRQCDSGFCIRAGCYS